MMAYENLKSTGIKYLLGKLKTVFLQIADAVKSVNGEEPDETGDITITTVPYAQNLESDSAHRNSGTFIQRTAGGESAVINGDAWLMLLKGNNEHTGYTAESINWSLTVYGNDGHISATFNRDTFVNYVESSGTITLEYSTVWSSDPALYGFTITGDPVNGDAITVVYVKEVRGTITVANPQAFVSTGWNLYDNANGYAKVVKYAHGYRVAGAYSTLKFATTPSGTQSDVTITDGNFDIPSDGYIIVTGGDSTSTAIYATMEDWTESYGGSFEAYSASAVNLTTVMSNYFPYGLLKAGSAVDELDLNIGQAISRVERLAYSAENLASAVSSGRDYEYDENYIYLARASAVVSSVSVDGNYTVNSHGIEYFTTTGLAVPADILYGNNLKDKLERDVLTISQQTLNADQKTQVRSNIGLGAAATLPVADNLTTATAGTAVLDAHQGKVLSDKTTKIYRTSKTAYTTGSGAFSHGIDTSTYYILSAVITSTTGFALWRGDNYLMIYNTAFSASTSTSVTCQIAYCKRNEMQT